MSNVEDEFKIKFASALFAWQHVETELFFTFEMLVWARERRVNSALWTSVLGLHARLAMLEACADIVLQDTPLRAEWAKIASRTRDCSKFRNHLAHLMPLAGRYSETGNPEIRLVTSVWDESKRKTVTYGIPQLVSMTSSFEDLAAAISDFGDKLKKIIFPAGTRPRGAQRIPWAPKG
jgi:hypothetical protein